MKNAIVLLAMLFVCLGSVHAQTAVQNADGSYKVEIPQFAKGKDVDYSVVKLMATFIAGKTNTSLVMENNRGTFKVVVTYVGKNYTITGNGKPLLDSATTTVAAVRNAAITYWYNGLTGRSLK